MIPSIFWLTGRTVAFVEYALSVQRSSVVLVIAFALLSGYTVVTTNGKGERQHGNYQELMREMLSSTFSTEIFCGWHRFSPFA